MTEPSFRDHARRVLERIDVLGAISEEPDRLTRRFATPALARATEVVAEWMREAGMDARLDPVGNVVGRLEGARLDGGTLLIGSHLDTVRDAGRFDGPLGVLVGIAAVERLAQHERLPFGVEVAGFADEEGTRFGAAYLGSKAFCGSFDPTYLDLEDGDGTTMRHAIALAGGDPEAIPGAAREPGDLLGYLEVHMEQGLVLEAEGLPIGVVSAIAGQTRARLTFAGEAGHAGTVPMALRRDALAAAAELVLAVEAVGRGEADLVATVGELAVSPGAGNVVPGRVVLSLDIRHPDDGIQAHAVDSVQRHTREIADRRGLSCRFELLQETAAVRCDERLSDLLRVAVEELGLPARSLVSGAGHDAAVVASIAPVAVLFVRCAAGISHSPEESVTESDIAVALDAVDGFLRRLALERISK